MMKYVYHGSPIPNLKIIQAKESTHMKKWVYACTSKAISTIFLSLSLYLKHCTLYL